MPCRCHPDRASGAAAILDKYRHPPRFGKFFPDNARQYVSSAAGRERYEHVERLARITGGLRGGRLRRQYADKYASGCGGAFK